MCHLAVSQSTRALSVLSRAHEAGLEPFETYEVEVILAYVLAELLDLPKEPSFC